MNSKLLLQLFLPAVSPRVTCCRFNLDKGINNKGSDQICPHISLGTCCHGKLHLQAVKNMFTVWLLWDHKQPLLKRCWAENSSEESPAFYMPTHHTSCGSESKKAKPVFKGNEDPCFSKGSSTHRAESALALEGQVGRWWNLEVLP